MSEIKDKIMTTLLEIGRERLRQDEKWGVQNHSPETWMNILMEEVGESSKAILEQRFAKHAHGCSAWHFLREELVQVAAVACAMIESLDRNEMRKL